MKIRTNEDTLLIVENSIKYLCADILINYLRTFKCIQIYKCISDLVTYKREKIGNFIKASKKSFSSLRLQ